MGKNQHFVPQFYFRLFSQDGANIQLYNLKSQKQFTGPFKSQASSAHFYSKNKAIEDNLSRIESSHATLVHKIIKDEHLVNLSKEDDFHLRMFIAILHNRTYRRRKETEEQVQFVLDYIRDSILIQDAGRRLSQKSDLKIEWQGASLLPLLFGMTSNYLIQDLKMILVINHTPIEFIFSDAPIILHNTYFNIRGSRGFQSLGLQIFCPLNPKFMLLLYDTECYNLKNLTGSTLIIDSVNDINAINSLQFFYCLENIYFADIVQFSNIIKLYTQNSNGITKRILTCKTIYKGKKGKNSYSELLRFSSSSIDYNLYLSFIYLNPSVKYRNCRNYKIIESYERLKKDLENSKKDRTPH